MGIGVTEIILIMAVAYFLFGPEKLPKVAAEFKKTISGFLKVKDEVQRSVFDIKKDIEDPIVKVRNELNSVAAEMTNGINKPLAEMERSVNEAVDPKNIFNIRSEKQSKNNPEKKDPEYNI
jgi:Sec-independent protein translocase protein TatA